jgi:GNAT superfamily N-acetyltransferase
MDVSEGMPIHNVWRRSATDFFGFRAKMGWGDADVEEMWRGVDIEAWDGHIGGNDDIRAEVLKDEPHWFLAPLMTQPEWQGRGIASKLMGWAIEQADKEGGQPMYLESAPTARNVYLRFDFEPIGEANLIRRGPRGRVKRERVGEKVGLVVAGKEVEEGIAS